ncbi:hypothetical protein ARC20_03395 [Stenotrophomonas panacihumi]|uniref:Transposase n=1 Tax=Stenotrophomonas panacihumi TaxID=676599 RepID=A0A0R0AZ60_9GAMM|nr:hypothetical protein [Stenotrophomonas panacihumi]KRG47386.1 hypothetical protein ARC20_03395 [Stenotrophomonas panacihumi]PTN55864.1 hypothetical protein C9J98_04635 [Stenotrophomonas panacihumi]
MDDRELKLHVARVMLTECSKRRHSAVNRNWYWRMFAYAQACRRTASAMCAQAAQADLFRGQPA